LDISLDKTENNEALIKVKLIEEDYQQGVDQKIKDYSKKAALKGFRPGKVPPGLIRKMYGQSFLIEEINKILSENLTNYLRESDLQFLAEPLPVKETFESIQWDNQKEFEFQYNAGYASDFDLKIDKKIKVDHAKIKVDESVLTETIENLQNQFGSPEVAEEIAEKDSVVGKISSKALEIERELTIDTKNLSKSGIKKFVGTKVGESVPIDAKKFFEDEEYLKRIAGMTEEDLKTAKNKFDFQVSGITRTRPAAVDQELFDKTFGKGNVDSLDAFKEKVKETISVNYDREADQFFNYKLKEQVRSKAKITLPDSFLKKWLLETNEQMTEELIETEYEMYSKELMWSLISSKIAKEQEIKVEHEEVVQEAKNQILAQFGGYAMADQLADQLDQFADNYLKGENGDNYMKVYNQVQNQKILDFAKSNVTIKEKEVSLEEFRKLS